MTDIETLMGLCSALALTVTEGATEAWDSIVGKAQNPPPDGASDETIDVETWHAAQHVAAALAEIPPRLRWLQEKHPTPQPKSQVNELAAIFAEMPGDTALWLDISRRLEVLRRHSDPDYRGPERDETVDYMTWAHLRNINRVVRDMAQAFAAMERGDDPDIPF
jgi:hypothetical protein